MSTKTTFKRIALVTVAALSFGLLSSVTPASAVATALTASVGPNGATSLTVVGGDSNTAAALIRLDVTNSDTATPGLAAGDTITASVTAPTTSTRGGSVADTGTAVGGTGTLARSDFTMLESAGQSTSGALGATAKDAVSAATNWERLASGTAASAFLDSATAGNTTSVARTADGKIDMGNTGYINMDSIHELTEFGYIKSYYVTVRARTGADIMDKGAYTFNFQLTDTNGVVRGNASVKIDFVSAPATSGAVVEVTQSGTFLANTAVASYDSTSAAWVKVQLKNRDGGLIRNHLGHNVFPSVAYQYQTTALPTWTDTGTAPALNDSGTYGSDFGTGASGNPLGSSTNRGFDGVYGVKFTTGQASNATTGYAYRIWAAYGNAPIVTSALTVYGSTVATGLTADPAQTTALVTAAGMSTADQAVLALSTAKNVTLPTTTTTATIKFTIKSSADTATGGALITAKPSWNAVNGSASVTPATSTTGTVYTTDALGNFSITVTNAAPIDTSKVTIVLSGAAAFGAGTNTVSITWAKPVANTIVVADPVSGVTALTGSTNVTTVLVRDQFGNPVSGQAVSVTEAILPAPTVASTTVITPIVTGANGTATYSYTAAATTTQATLTFNTSPTPVAANAVHVYKYLATLPVVATLTPYHGFTWGSTNSSGTADILTPATGIYASGTTMLTLDDARDISKTLVNSDSSATNDEMVLRFTGLTAAGVSAEGASVTITAGTGGWIIDASGLPAKSRTFAVTATGVTANVLATGTGAITFTATSGTVTATASMWVAGRVEAAGRFITVTGAKTGTANGTGVPVTVAVTDRYGNPVSGVDLNVVASGVGSFMGGAITQSFKTDASGTYTFLANTGVSEGGVAKFTATTGSTAGGFRSLAGYVGTTEVDATLAAGNTSASAEITFAAGASATDVAQTATDAAAEATDAANAATDAANAAAEAADAATAAAQDAADAVAALSTQVSEMVNALKKQITALTNLVIKIQKKVRA
jgi:trimeric autotransporter adhesin